LNFNISGIEVQLLHQKAILLKESKVLVVSDLHLGKIEHFRASGIGLPVGATEQTIVVLDQLVVAWNPTQIIFLGDLFHSYKNSAFSLFEDWRLRYRELDMILIHGNHDIMSNQDYSVLGLKTYPEYQIGALWLTHELQPITDEESRFNLSGHVHPGIRLHGKGKQSLTLPCFWFGDRQGLLPAFGHFTGKHMVDIHKNSTIFAIANDQIIRII
jgi:uncharacterized protein